MAEIAFEALLAAHEATRGTAVSPPTHHFPLSGTITPGKEVYRPAESRGQLAEFSRSKTVRRTGAWQAEGGLDPNYAPFLLNLAVKGGVTAPTTPSGATLARLWTFLRSMTSDDLKSATMYFGDPNVQVWQMVHCMADEFTIGADVSGTDGATLSMSGFGKFPTKVADPVVPAQITGDLLMPGAMQVWMDTSSAIGTTEIVGRVVSAELTHSNAVSRKHVAAGPTSDLSFSRTGRGKSHPESTIVVELLDTAQYDLWASGDVVKMRVRLNGGLIESGFYSFVDWDIVGELDAFDWGELEGTNRTMTFTVLGQYDATMGSDLVVRCQNTRTTL